MLFIGGDTMAKEKYYAVRKGLKTGIFTTWDQCNAAVQGYSGAEYKSFSNKEEAEKYINNETMPTEGQSEESLSLQPTKVIAYVDGSYDGTLKKYSFGCVILTPLGETIKEYGNGDNPDSLVLHNVAGEMLGAMFAVKWAIKNGYSEIELRYDYEGIEKWVTGEWKAKTELTQKYANAMKDWGTNIHLTFQKVIAHSNNKYNDLADSLAKTALTEGKGIPKIKQGDFWFTADGINRSDLLAIIELIKEEYGEILSCTQQNIAHGTSYAIKSGRKDRIVVNHYNSNKLVIQGKPNSIFSCIITYVTELVDIEDIPKIFNQTYRLDIDKENIKNEFQYYLPNSYDKFDSKMSRVLHQAVYNLNLSGDLFDGTFLAQPALRVLEGHLKKIVIERNIVPDNNYIKYNGFNFFDNNGSKYQLKSSHLGTATAAEVSYIGRCYTFYHNNRHILEHWDDPTAPLDTTKTLDCNQAHDLIRRTLEIIDDFYTI